MMYFFIAAKTNSERVPAKNIAPFFDGKSSLDLVDEAQLRSRANGDPSRTRVLTDSYDMARHTQLPFLIDNSDIRGKDVGLIALLQSTAQRLNLMDDDEYVLLWGNNPLLRTSLIQEAIRRWYGLEDRTPNTTLQTFSPFKGNLNDVWLRGDLDSIGWKPTTVVDGKAYYVNGGIRIGNAASLLAPTYNPDIRPFIVSPLDSWEIDTLDDVFVCQELLRLRSLEGAT